MDSFSFFVPGEPITEGSVRTFTSGQRVVVTHDRGSELDQWRLRVARAAEAAARKAGWEPRHDGPVAVTAIFLLPRPKSVPKSRQWPHVKPDLDKLQRAVGSKHYAGDPRMVGATITVSTVDLAGLSVTYAFAEWIAVEESSIQEEAS